MLKKYKAKHAWVGKVIHWELYQGLKFDHADKYIYKPDSFLEDEIHKILLDFEI